MRAAEVLRGLGHYLKPPPRLAMSNWAARNRVLSSEESSVPGPYDPEFNPPLNGIMDAISDPEVERVCLMGSTRVGKSFVIQTTVGYFADLDPAPMLYMRPRDADAEAFSKQEITWLFRDTPCLQGKISANSGKASNNTLQYKAFPGGSIKLIGAQSTAALSGFAARIVALDEIDRYEALSTGNPVDLAIGRTTTYTHNKKIVYTSSPTFEHQPTSKRITIHAVWLQSSQAHYEIACPHCGGWQALEWERVRYAHCKDTLDDVFYQCAHCEGRITEAEKREAIRQAYQGYLAGGPDPWVHTYPERKIKGFHLSQLYSPFTTLREICEEWIRVTTNRSILGIQRFKNEVLGLPFTDDSSLYRDSSDVLYNRRETYHAPVPMGACLLTMGVDTQDDRLHYVLVGWGPGQQAWIIESAAIYGDPATPGPWAALNEKIYATYRHESGVHLRVSRVFIDTGGHHTSHVHAYLKGRGPVVQGIFGARTPGKPIVTKPKRDTHTGLMRWEIGTEAAKTEIHAIVSNPDEGPRFMHFGTNLDEDFFREIFSERLVEGRYKKVGSRRNEVLDCMGYALAAMYAATRSWSLDQLAEILREAAGSEEDDEEQEAPPVPVVRHPRVARRRPVYHPPGG